MAAAAGKSRFAVTCALLRQYMREHRGQMDDLAGLFQAPAPPVAPEENDDERIMQLFPIRAAVAKPAQERPEMKKQASMAIFYEVPHQVDDAQMRAASLHRFLRKRKVRISDTNPDRNEDSTPAKKQKDAAAGKPFQDVPDPSWLRL
ncbi:hypothetical protein GQ55_9G305700 [Panicum hallii var. hallii]|uniref:Uncharacterized protein n=1 Tax=Panicum hallii var. hallii TaxID=1504633 RepID=A0A2T7C7T6_9POAL|nr:hypothetical protein GQ55_9G305700 [Panicum hallii var. hallii]